MADDHESVLAKYGAAKKLNARQQGFLEQIQGKYEGSSAAMGSFTRRGTPTLAALKSRGLIDIVPTVHGMTTWNAVLTPEGRARLGADHSPVQKQIIDALVSGHGMAADVAAAAVDRLWNEVDQGVGGTRDREADIEKSASRIAKYTKDPASLITTLRDKHELTINSRSSRKGDKKHARHRLAELDVFEAEQKPQTATKAKKGLKTSKKARPGVSMKKREEMRQAQERDYFQSQDAKMRHELGAESDAEAEKRFRRWEKEWEKAKPSAEQVATALEDFGYSPGAAREHAEVYLDEVWEDLTEQGRYVGGPESTDMDPDNVAKTLLRDKLNVKDPEKQRTSPLIGGTDFEKSMAAKKAKRATEGTRSPAEMTGTKPPVLKPHPNKSAAMKKFQQAAAGKAPKAQRGLKRGKKGGMYYETAAGKKVYVK